jgi:single-strand DNA-binding protein
MLSNSFTVTGNLGADPELHKKNENSSGVVSFNLAENVSRYSEESRKYEQTHTNWFQVRSFGNLAARVKAILKKGDRVTVFGKIRTYQYEDKSGQSRFGFEVLADDIAISSILPKASEPDFDAFKDDEVSL